MTTDNRMTRGLIIDVLNLLERHGYHKHDNQHTGQAAGVIYHLARVYEGDRDTPYGTYPGPAPAPPEPPRPARQADPGAVTIVPLHDDGTVTLVRQYRAAVDALVLEIPAGTQPHETLVIRGAGMPALRGRRHGDLRVMVNVVVPRHLDHEQRELYERVAGSLTDHNLRSGEGVFAKLKRALRA